MRNRVVRKLSFGLMLMLTIATISTLAVSPQNAPAQKEAFEVASVKLIVPGSGPGRPGMFMNAGPGCSLTGVQVDPRRVAVAAPLFTLIATAHGGNCRVPDMIIGGTDWMKTDRWDIEAVMPEGSPTYTPAQFVGGNAPKINAMLQTLLADRFKVAVHRETREVTVNVLTVGKGSPKLTAANDADQPARRINARKDQEGKPFLEFIAGKATMATLAEMLQLATSRPVVDRTGITGNFNIRFEYDNDGVAKPTIFTVLQEELGLRLESAKEKMEVLVIDRAEKPSEN